MPLQFIRIDVQDTGAAIKPSMHLALTDDSMALQLAMQRWLQQGCSQQDELKGLVLPHPSRVTAVDGAAAAEVDPSLAWFGVLLQASKLEVRT